ncbi:Y4yA family PLP-dependent enzyme [Nocardia sp. NPDC057227]|uniref:Y4yA family PLP-dependent enzyme n=1 Tax=Nocardia sp. NPDC057227 TaxID=3346056 RepID=UPI003624DBD6
MGLTGIAAAPLPAHRDRWEQRLLADPVLLGELASILGGPFHVLFPDRVLRAVHEFRAAFEAAGVTGAIYYGKKANKAACVARACARAGAGIDVASTGELVGALAQGVRGGELVVTGPAKPDELLWLAARHGALIAVDALDELDRLPAATDGAPPPRILLRALPAGSTSRFGLTDAELDEAHARLDGLAGRVRWEGLSFHLSGYDAAQRAKFAHELLDRLASAAASGHPARTLSIGGGFGVDYVPAAAWAEFTAAAGPHWFHGDTEPGSYYPYHFPVPGAAMLTAILRHRGLAERLVATDTVLAVEPGRALLDRAGCTVFRVQGRKTRLVGGEPYDLLTVDGTSLSLSEQWFDSEYLPDPVLWPPRPGVRTPTSVGAATCLDSDMLSRRRVPLPRRAEPGDLLIYPNTAGYQMDSNESAFHDLPVPPKIVLTEHGEALRWRLDAAPA